MRVAYVRVSTAEQNEARQIEGLKKYDIEKWYTEKVSGKNMDRPELKTMLDFVREGDTIYIHDLSRLARSTSDLLRIVDLLNAKKVNLVSNKETIDSTTPTGKLMLTMIGAINEFERACILDRQREGIAIHKAAGGYAGIGRHERTVDPDELDALIARWKNREISKAQIAKELGISRPTANKIIDKRLKEVAE